MGQHSINGVQEKCFKTKKGQYQTKHNKENKLLLKSLLSSAKFNQHVDRFKFGNFSWQLSALLLITMWLLERASQCDTLTQCVNRRRLRRHVRALGLLDPGDLWTLGWRAATHSWGTPDPWRKALGTWRSVLFSPLGIQTPGLFWLFSPNHSWLWKSPWNTNWSRFVVASH